MVVTPVRGGLECEEFDRLQIVVKLNQNYTTVYVVKGFYVRANGRIKPDCLEFRKAHFFLIGPIVGSR